MPRFYFHRYGDTIIAEEDGRELTNLQAARTVAVQEAREMKMEADLQGLVMGSCRVAVADEGGRIVALVSDRDTVCLGE